MAKRPDRLRVGRSLDDVMHAHVQAVLVACHGNQTTTAEALGIDRKTLARSLRKWGVHVELAKLPPAQRRSLDEVARGHVQDVLAACDGNQSHAARALDVDRKTLARSLRRWGIPVVAGHRAFAPGSLIALEGLDGAGLSTQAQRLVAWLNARGHRALGTAEPSGGPVGTLIRRVLAGKTALVRAGAARTLSLLFAADRVEHFHRVVAPALASGTTVVSDRWYHSSLAYQRTGVERDWIMALNRHTRTPDATVYLAVRPEVGQARRAAAGRAPEYFHDVATQRAVVAGYQATIAELRAEGEHIVAVDGERSEAVVFAAVLRALGLDKRAT